MLWLWKTSPQVQKVYDETILRHPSSNVAALHPPDAATAAAATAAGNTDERNHPDTCTTAFGSACTSLRLLVGSLHGHGTLQARVQILPSSRNVSQYTPGTRSDKTFLGQKTIVKSSHI